MKFESNKRLSFNTNSTYNIKRRKNKTNQTNNQFDQNKNEISLMKNFYTNRNVSNT